MTIAVPNELRLLADMIAYVAQLEQRCRLSTGAPGKGYLLITADDARRIGMINQSLVFLETHQATILRARAGRR